MLSLAHTHGAVIALVDGEHYPSAVCDTIHHLRGQGINIRAAALVGGTEKLRTSPDYGVPHVVGINPLDAVRAALAACPEATAVVDLADEPVLVFEQRLAVIGALAGRGLTWIGADATVEPPVFEDIPVPSIAIIGTGKRIGKTAISGYTARFLNARIGREQDADIVVVAMGRGGPAAPVVVDAAAGPVTVDRLLEISRSGSHASSDYLEDAALTGLTTIGCRRVGGGILGVPVHSNIVEGAQLAAAMDPRLVILEGSGSCIPPVRTEATMLIGSTRRPRDLFDDLGVYRLERANLVLIVGDDAETGSAMARQVMREHPGTHALSVRLEPTPISDISGQRCAVFTSAPAEAMSVFERRIIECGADPVLISSELANRDHLRRDVDRALDMGVDAFVVEIKAAGIDVVAEAADAAEISVVFLDNPPCSNDPDIDLDGELVLLAARAGVDA